MFLSWLWQFNSFLWGIVFFFCQKWVRVLVGRRGGGFHWWVEKKKGKSKVVENFSHSYYLLPSTYKLLQRYCAFIHPLMCSAKLGTNNQVLYKLTAVGQQVLCTVVVIDRTFQLFPKYEPKLCELPISHRAMNVRHWAIKIYCFELQSSFPLL
jgi:hypothetical protein